jgi:hypothetical protein
MEKLKQEGKDWSTFLFVSNYQVDLPTSPPKYKKPRKQSAGSSSAAVAEIPKSPIALVFKDPLPFKIAKKDKGKGKAKKISTEEREEQFDEPAGHHSCLRMFSHNDIDFNEHSIEIEEADRLEAL